jgi:hypothetical protein
MYERVVNEVVVAIDNCVGEATRRKGHKTNGRNIAFSLNLMVLFVRARTDESSLMLGTSMPVSPLNWAPGHL